MRCAPRVRGERRLRIRISTPTRNDKGTATPSAIALSAFDICSLIFTIGVLACRLAVVPRADAALARRLDRLAPAALALLTLASFGILVSRTLEMNGGDVGTLWADVRVALAVTHFGHVWWWRVPALVVAWLAWGWAWRSRRAWALWAMLPAIAAIALTRSETGHPADHGNFTAAVWVDWLHLLAAGTWVGGIFGMSLAVFPPLVRARERAVARTAEIFQRLSRLSGAALAVLVACGIFNVTQQLGGVAGLWTSRYGAALDVKLALVLAMILIGAHNRYFKLPRLLDRAGLAGHRGPLARIVRAGTGAPERGGGDGPAVIRACARAVFIEALLGLAVIGATATLIHAMPPADEPPGMSMPMTRAAPPPTPGVA